jgi:hypothetical protein
MNKPHVHCNEIHAWANGEEIEYLDSVGDWVTITNPTWSVNNKYRIKDPYRELKAAAADPTKEIKVKNNPLFTWKTGEFWVCPDGEHRFSYAPEDYEIRDKPKPKVKMWQWIVTRNAGVFLTDGFFEKEPKVIPGSEIIKRADWTEIEVDA